MQPTTTKKQRDIIYILASALVLVVFWIGFSIYHKYATSTVNEDYQSQLQPIDPNFDTRTLNKIKTRTQVTPALELTGAPQSKTTPTPGATQSAKITVIPTKPATSSAVKSTGGH